MLNITRRKSQCINRFIANTIYEIKERQKYSGLRRYKYLSSDIVSLAKQDSIKGKYLDYDKYNETIIQLQGNLLQDKFIDRNYLKPISNIEIGEKYNVSFRIFINGNPILSEDLRFFFDINKTIIAISNKYNVDTLSIIRFNNTKEINESDKGKYDSNMIFYHSTTNGFGYDDSSSLKNIFVSNCIKIIKDNTKEYIDIGNLLHEDSIVVCKSGTLEEIDKIINLNNGILKIKDFKSSELLDILYCMYESTKQEENMFLKSYKDNSIDLIQSIIENYEIPQTIMNMPIYNLRQEFTIEKYNNSGKSIDQFIDDVIKFMIEKYPDFYQILLEEVYYDKYKVEFKYVVDDSFINSRRRTDVNQDISHMNKPLTGNHIVLRLDTDDSDKIFAIFINGKNYVTKEYYRDFFKGTFAYIPESDIKVGDIVELCTIDNREIIIDTSFTYSKTGTVKVVLDTIIDFIDEDDIGLFCKDNDRYYEVFDYDISLDNKTIILTNIPEEHVGKEILIKLFSKEITYNLIAKSGYEAEEFLELDSRLELVKADKERFRIFLNERLVSSSYGALTVPSKTNSIKVPKISFGVEVKEGDKIRLEYGKRRKVIYEKDTIRNDGIIIMDNLNLPYSKKYIEMYVNGLKVPNDDIKVMCPYMVRVKGLKSLKNLQLVTLLFKNNFESVYSQHKDKSILYDIFRNYEHVITKQNIVNLMILDDLKNGNYDYQTNTLTDGAKYQPFIENDFISLDLSLNDKHSEKIYNIDLQKSYVPDFIIPDVDIVEDNDTYNPSQMIRYKNEIIVNKFYESLSEHLLHEGPKFLDCNEEISKEIESIFAFLIENNTIMLDPNRIGFLINPN